MGVGAGIFRMTNSAKNANSANLTEQEMLLSKAYLQSASQDQLLAADFESSLTDGLKDDPLFNQSMRLISANLDAS